MKKRGGRRGHRHDSKPYEAPRLTVYGDFRRLTATNKGGVQGDSGAKPNTRLGAVDG
ncbi:MAG: lasso RiPP family leader peptide-containing protein [Actinomycetota bacterium]